MAAGKRVGVVVGGRGVLRDRSMAEGGLVRETLVEYGLEPYVLVYDSAILDRIGQLRIDLLYDATFGVYGRIQALADLTGRGIVGNPLRASEIYDKVILKEALKRHGLTTPKYVALDRYTCDTTWGLLAALKGPVVVKPASADILSFGVRHFTSVEPEKETLQDHVHELFELDEKVIVETFIEGEELCAGFSALALYGFQMFPPMSICKQKRLFDYETKVSKEYEFVVANVSAEEAAYLARVGRTLAKEFEITDYFYINGIRDRAGILYVFDAGTTVGLGDKSFFPSAARLLGLSVKDLVIRQFDNHFAKVGIRQPGGSGIKGDDRAAVEAGKIA